MGQNLIQQVNPGPGRLPVIQQGVAFRPIQPGYTYPPFDFLGFTIRQYPAEKTPAFKTVSRSPGWNVLHGFAPEKPAPGYKTVITPSEEASKRHLAVIG